MKEYEPVPIMLNITNDFIKILNQVLNMLAKFQVFKINPVILFKQNE